MAGNNFTVDYEDERFQNVEAEKQTAINESNAMYDQMINESDKLYENQINASKEWADKQQQLQQEQTDFTIEQIQQQQEKMEKEHKKELSGAYVDYQKQTNQYGAEAEQLAASGLTQTGFSESSKISAFNTYQNRVATAKASVNEATVQFANAIKEAQLQNNSAMAEIAFNAYQQQLELALEGFQQKNSLILGKADAKTNLESTYYGRWQDVLAQINQENALAEEQRQYNEQMAYQKEQDALNYQLQLKQLEEDKRQFNASLKASSSGGSSSIQKGSYAVNTAYYQGDLNNDATKYGTFSNGYQPKGISGYGEVKKSGEKITLETQTLSGQRQTVTQNVWKTSDGTLWYWDGRYNKYIEIKG